MCPVQEVASASSRPPHILLVEDEFNLGKGLQMVLSEEGYKVNLAMTGLSALETFKGNGFNLVVADLRLPDIDGLEVLKQISDERPQTKMLVITGYPSVSSAVTAMKMGVYDYISKPFTEDEFMTAVVGALNATRRVAFPQEPSLEGEKGRLIEKQEVIRLLDRTAKDADFWAELMTKGSEALEGYRISRQAKAAIINGDVEWLRKNVGTLTGQQLQFVYKRLEREVW
jgi:DNA-binding NtrC family response regulator